MNTKATEHVVSKPENLKPAGRAGCRHVKIVAAVAEVLEDGALNIIGMGQTSSRGLKRAWW